MVKLMTGSLQCVGTLTLFGSTIVLLGYVYWAETAGRGRPKHKEFKKVIDFGLDPPNPAMSELDSLNANHFEEFSYKNFMDRRRQKLKEEAEKLTKMGDLNVYNSKKVSGLDSCVPFKTKRNNTRLCVHSALSDPYISSHIRKMGTWEPGLVEFMVNVLSKNPDMHLVDLGCNVGVYTMAAAVVGKRVVAVDPIISNLFLLHSSLMYGGLRDNVTLLLNAVSDKVEKMLVRINHQNLGGSIVQPLGNEPPKEGSLLVDAIVLDDLLRLVNFKNVFIKMDVEGYEANILRRATNFFKKRNVMYIMMEWIFHRHSPDGKQIIKFLLQWNLLPYEKVSPPTRLSLNVPHEWPDNIVWIHNSMISKHS